MADDDVVVQPHVTAGFEFTKPTGVKYSSEKASIFIPLAVADASDFEGVKATAEQALLAAMHVVYEALGVEYQTEYADDGTERAVALIKETFGPGVVIETSGQSDGGGAGGGSATSGPRKVTVLKPYDDNPPAWLDERWQALVDRGEVEPSDNEVWDNRRFLQPFGGNKDPDKTPWFRTSKGKVGIFKSDK